MELFDLPLSVIARARKRHKVYFVLLLLCVTARLFTGAAEAQVNFLGLLATPVNTNSLAQGVSSDSLGVAGPHIADRRDASSIPENHAEYKLYKKYVMPNCVFYIEENYFHRLEQLLVSIEATSYYIKDLTLRTLHSNSPPAPVTALLLTVFMYLFINRFGAFGSYGESKNISDRRFGLQ